MKLMLFTAPWCGQCKAYHPTVDKFMKKHPQIEFEEVNVELQEEVATEYNVKSLPTTIIISWDGSEFNRATGIQSLDQLEKLIRE